MKLNDFGLLLTSAINNIDENTNIKRELILISDKHRRNLIKNKENINKKQEFYLTNYENKREELRMSYDVYLANRKILLDKWKETGSIADLKNLVAYRFENIENIPNIYTYDIKISKLK